MSCPKFFLWAADCGLGTIFNARRFALSDFFCKGGIRMENWLRGKTAIVIGERDGVQGPSIAKCLEAAGAKVVYAVTECFV